MLDAGTPMMSTIVPTAGAVGTAESVQLVGLAGVVAEARSAHPQARLVCKLDCEGAEFEILTSAPVEALREVDQLIVEYHYRDPQPIVEVLRAAGLSVSELPERHRVERDGEVGMLLAVR